MGKRLAAVWSWTLLLGSGAAAAQQATPEPTPVEVVVEGDPLHPHRGSKDASVAATVLKRERLQAPGLSAVGALRGTPGIVATELGGSGSPGSVSLRGASSAQTPIYLAGVRLNDQVSGSVDLGRVPLWFIDRIEVYRGNAPIEADRLGIGGAIFIEPRRSSGDVLELGALVGSHGTVGTSAVVGSGTAADGVIAGVGFGRAENNYTFVNEGGTAFDPSDDVSERRQNIDAGWIDVWVHGRRRVGTAQIALVANHAQLERGAQRSESLPVRNAREETSRELVALRSRVPLAGLDNWLQTDSSIHVSGVTYRDPARELGLSATRVDVSDVRVDHSVGLRLRPHAAWLVRPMVAWGVERLVRREMRDGASNEQTALSAHRVDMRPLLASETKLIGTPFGLRAIVALECTSTGLDTVGVCDRGEPVGRVGPSLEMDGLSAYLNLARSVRSPTLGERYGVSPILRGNPTLVAERGFSVDLGGRYEHTTGLRFWIDTVGFARFVTDEIEYVRAGQRYLIPENRDRARHLGWEFAGGIAPIAGVRVDVAVSLLDARNTTPGRPLANDVLTMRPRLVVAPAVTLERELKSSTVQSVALVGRYTYQSSRYQDPAGLGVLPEQSNLGLQLDARWLDRHLTTRLRVDNVLDERRRSDALGYPLPGRSAFVSAEWTY